MTERSRRTTARYETHHGTSLQELGYCDSFPCSFEYEGVVVCGCGIGAENKIGDVAKCLGGRGAVELRVDKDR